MEGAAMLARALRGCAMWRAGLASGWGRGDECKGTQRPQLGAAGPRALTGGRQIWIAFWCKGSGACTLTGY